MSDTFNATTTSRARASQRRKSLKLAVTVRNPLAMVAHGYCYHHEGHELMSTWPVERLRNLAPAEGTQLMAEAHCSRQHVDESPESALKARIICD